MGVMIKKQWILFCYALSFFSRVPVPKSINFKMFPFHLGNAYLPLIGLLYAFVCFSVYSFMAMFFEPVVSVVIMLCAGLLLTGAFHEDGFADSCDGFGGGYSKTQRLAIMKDSHIGTYGVVGLILLFVLKINLLTNFALQGDYDFFYLLISMAVLSRFSVLSVMQFSQYARENEKSKSTLSSNRLPYRYLLTALFFSLLSLCWMPLIWAFVCVSTIGLTTLSSGLYFNKQLGGYSGDCLGFLQQLNEIILLLTVTALLK
ncbi:adenosylcobinamide-GDP ribazoletransferase [Psychromonas sp.]|nr:adenosylcobinamide-GDP ribazoletransferase [Psychromonas sp.]